MNADHGQELSRRRAAIERVLLRPALRQSLEAESRGERYAGWWREWRLVMDIAGYDMPLRPPLELENRARLAYAGVNHRRGPLYRAHDLEILLVAATARLLVGDSGSMPTSCGMVAAALEMAFDQNRHVRGSFIGPLGKESYSRPGGPHSWNVSHGRIIDAACEQFGTWTPLRIAGGDQRASWYASSTPVAATRNGRKVGGAKVRAGPI